SSPSGVTASCCESSTAPQAKSQVSTTSTINVNWAQTSPRGIVWCGSCASSAARGTVSMITSPHNAYRTAATTARPPLGPRERGPGQNSSQAKFSRSQGPEDDQPKNRPVRHQPHGLRLFFDAPDMEHKKDDNGDERRPDLNGLAGMGRIHQKRDIPAGCQ